MRRTNLVLDERLLEETKHALGAKTYSATVNLALAEALRVKKALDLPAFFGSGIWQVTYLRCVRINRRVSAHPRGARGLRSDPGGHFDMDLITGEQAESWNHARMLLTFVTCGPTWRGSARIT